MVVLIATLNRHLVILLTLSIRNGLFSGVYNLIIVIGTSNCIVIAEGKGSNILTAKSFYSDVTISIN